MNDATEGVTAPQAPRSDPDVRTAVRGVAVRPLWVAFALASVPFALGIDLPLWLQYVPLVASAVVFGMPHGAVDHLVPARLSGTSRTRSVAVVSLAYLLLGGGYLLAWFLAPVAAAVAFVLLTWVHWGQGDLYLLAAATGDRYPRSIGHRLLSLVVRGAMPMALPLVAFPDQYRRVVADLVGLFGGDPAAVAVAFGSRSRLAVGVLVGGLVVATLVRGVLTHSGRGWTVEVDDGVRIDAVELAILLAFFATVPPVLAVGLYFCLWHSVRHVVRLLAAEEVGATALRERRPLVAVGRFARDAAPTTAVALAAVAVLYPLVPSSPSGIAEAVALYLVVVAALTVPHVAVVTWMDFRQGIWSGNGDPDRSRGT